MRRERGWTITETIVCVGIVALSALLFGVLIPNMISAFGAGRVTHAAGESGDGVTAQLVIMPPGVADMWRYHDDIKLVTCWKIQEGRDLFCIPDWQLSPPPCGELERERTK